MEKPKSKIPYIAALTVLCIGVVVLCIYISANKKIKPVESDSWAMGSAVSLKIYTDDNDRAGELSQSAFKAVADTDAALSSTIATSDISLLNASGGETVKISAFTADKLSQTVMFCKTAANFAADGSVPIDITVGRLSSLWNIGSGSEKVPSREEIDAALKTTDVYSVKADSEKGTASIKAGQTLDLGAFGKGIAADGVCEALSDDSLPAIADIGGTILLFGKNPNSRNGTWSVGIRNPFDMSSYCMTAEINTADSSSGAAFVSTSGSYEKFFIENGVKYHHILSTVTGFPVETDIVSVTVISYHSGLEADGLSTACFTMGLTDSTLKMLKSCSAQAVFITKDGKYYSTDGISDKLTAASSSFVHADYASYSEAE